MRGGGTPQLREPLVPAAVPAVELVAHGILPVIMLVVLLGRVELGSGNDLGHDRLREAPGFGELPLRLFGEAPLCLVVEKDRGAILPPVITELRVGRERINVMPENLQQL